LKVAFISNSIYDGAGIAAHRIFRAVTKKGIEGLFFQMILLQAENLEI
jgi:hypothetical protein